MVGTEEDLFLDGTDAKTWTPTATVGKNAWDFPTVGLVAATEMPGLAYHIGKSLALHGEEQTGGIDR